MIDAALMHWLSRFMSNCCSDYSPQDHEGHAEIMKEAYSKGWSPMDTACALQEGWVEKLRTGDFPDDWPYEAIVERKDAIETVGKDELERLRDASRFTMQDYQRALRRSDVEGICRSLDMCFEYSDRVRCGPCAIQQSARCGVDVHDTNPASAEEWRQRRRLRVATAEIAGLRAILKRIVEAHDGNGGDPAASRDVVGAHVDYYRDIVGFDIDPALVAVSAKGELKYADVPGIFEASGVEGEELGRRVREWAKINLEQLPNGGWRDPRASA